MIPAICWSAPRGTRRRPSTGWGSLTPTEVDVVRLIIDRLGNPEVADRLFMSHETIKTHLPHVYAKLGVGCGRRQQRKAGRAGRAVGAPRR